MRALGLDLGSVRIGVAVSDSDGRVATPYDVVVRTTDPAADRRRISRLAGEVEAEVLVVGLPLGLDGEVGEAARRAIAEAEALGDATGLPVETYDERLTTVSADQVLREQGLDARQRRSVVDKVAASIILQGWLDHRALRTESPESREPPCSRV